MEASYIGWWKPTEAKSPTHKSEIETTTNTSPSVLNDCCACVCEKGAKESQTNGSAEWWAKRGIEKEHALSLMLESYETPHICGAFGGWSIDYSVARMRWKESEFFSSVSMCCDCCGVGVRMFTNAVCMLCMVRYTFKWSSVVACIASVRCMKGKQSN